jgi:DNA polymerase epsilon subunit 1
MSFARWLQSPSNAPSRLHDPLLQRLVHRLSSQVFNLLMKRLKMLDCRVIYASFHKLLIYTGKETDEDARGHVNFAIATVMKDPLFAKLRLEIGESYSILLFKDIANMAGVREAEPTKTFLRMDIVSHLPEAIRGHFGDLVSLFVAQIAAHNRMLAKQRDDLSEDIDGIRMAENGEYTTRAADHDFIADLVTKKFAQRLFSLVGDFLNRKADDAPHGEEQSDEDLAEDPDEERIEDDMREAYWEEDPLGEFANPVGKGTRPANVLVEARKRRERERVLRERRRWEFPARIGSHCDFVSPALEFCKLMCTHILGADEAFQYEASQVKANLLRMIHCKEFSKEATQGLEPSLVLVIPDVVCENCLHVADVDICRDPALNGTRASRPHDAAATAEAWLCEQCDGELSKLEIEQRLMDLVNKRLVSYQMQDLACKKCKMVKNNLCAQYCDCTGEYEQTQGQKEPGQLPTPNLLNEMSDIRLFMALMRNFAQAHGFAVLRDVTAQIMQVCE